MLTGFFALKIWILEKRSILRFSSGNPKQNLNWPEITDIKTIGI